MIISNNARFWLVSKRFTLESWADDPDIGILRDSDGKILHHAIGRIWAGDTGKARYVTAAENMKRRLYAIIKDEGLTTLLDCYPVEITFKTYAHKDDVMPNITKLLLTRLED